MNVIEVLTFEEGYRGAPYYCSEGYPTVGIGQRIGPKGAPLENYEFSVPITVAQVWLAGTVGKIEADLEEYSWFNNAPVDVRDILISMAYQLGLSGLLKFKNMIKALDEGDYMEAAAESLDSRWATQTPERAKRHASVIAQQKYGKIYDMIQQHRAVGA